VAKWRAGALSSKGLDSPGHIFELATLRIRLVGLWVRYADGDRVDDSRIRQRKSFQKPGEAWPNHPSLPRATVKPVSPSTCHGALKARQCT
jgi:hypothetical protein